MVTRFNQLILLATLFLLGVIIMGTLTAFLL